MFCLTSKMHIQAFLRKKILDFFQKKKQKNRHWRMKWQWDFHFENMGVTSQHRTKNVEHLYQYACRNTEFRCQGRSCIRYDKQNPKVRDYKNHEKICAKFIQVPIPRGQGINGWSRKGTVWKYGCHNKQKPNKKREIFLPICLSHGDKVVSYRAGLAT